MGLCGEHIQEYYTVFLTKVRTYKIAFTTQKQNLGGEGASDPGRQVPLLKSRHLWFGVLIVIWSMGKPLTTGRAAGGERFSMTIFAGDHRDSHTRERFLLRIH
jgi:hypothetical protein